MDRPITLPCLLAHAGNDKKINKVVFTILMKLAIYIIIPLPGGMTQVLLAIVGIYSILLTLSDRSGCIKSEHLFF